MDFKCPKCKSKNVVFWVDLFIEAPMKFYSLLSKKNLRSKEVKIMGANWPKERFYCNNCGWTIRGEK
jgi:hypothetical protein